MNYGLRITDLKLIKSVLYSLFEIHDSNKCIAVPRGGVEPPSLSAYAPEAYVVASFTIWALVKRLNISKLNEFFCYGKFSIKLW